MKSYYTRLWNGSINKFKKCVPANWKEDAVKILVHILKKGRYASKGTVQSSLFEKMGNKELNLKSCIKLNYSTIERQ